MGTRAEAVFDGTESYDPRAEYQRGETVLRLAEGCCHLCFRSPPEIAFMYERYDNNVAVPCCVECAVMSGEDPDAEEIEVERWHNQFCHFRDGWWFRGSIGSAPSGSPAGRLDALWHAGWSAADLAFPDTSEESMLAAFEAWSGS